MLRMVDQNNHKLTQNTQGECSRVVQVNIPVTGWGHKSIATLGNGYGSKNTCTGRSTQEKYINYSMTCGQGKCNYIGKMHEI